jgi:RNA polymerase-associated protein CTR9
MVGAAVLDMASLDETSSEFNSLMEKAIKMMSMANLLDHSNAMVQNHLANHYFWKWTPLSGSVEVTQGSKLVKGSQPIPLDPGERIRIGPNFETYVADETDDADEEGTTVTMRDPWKEATTSKLSSHYILGFHAGTFYISDTIFIPFLTCFRRSKSLEKGL